MSVGAQEGNSNAAKNESDKMSSSFLRREQRDGFRGNQYAKVVNDQSGHLPKVVVTTLITTKRTPKTS